VFDNNAKDNPETDKTSHNNTLIEFNKSNDLLDVNKVFTSSIDRTIDSSLNREFSQLILESKFDLKNEKIKIKSTALDQSNEIEAEILEINLGKIKSFPNQPDLKLSEDQIKILENNPDYEFEVSVMGKKINEEEKINLNAYLALNNEERHYISPVIFHEDPENSKNKTREEDTIFSYMLKNPFIILIFLTIGYYIYPNMWKKDYFMALSEDFNNKKIIDENRKIYDYINYRRGLYVSVRSNFS
jgi:hypothetical protein